MISKRYTLTRREYKITTIEHSVMKLACPREIIIPCSVYHSAVPLTGLLSQYLSQAAVERQSSSLRRRKVRLQVKGETGGQHVDSDLDTGCILPQRKESLLPRGHHPQPPSLSPGHGYRVVRC